MFLLLFCCDYFRLCFMFRWCSQSSSSSHPHTAHTHTAHHTPSFHTSHFKCFLNEKSEPETSKWFIFIWKGWLFGTVRVCCVSVVLWHRLNCKYMFSTAISFYIYSRRRYHTIVTAAIIIIIFIHESVRQWERESVVRAIHWKLQRMKIKIYYNQCFIERMHPTFFSPSLSE